MKRVCSLLIGFSLLLTTSPVHDVAARQIPQGDESDSGAVVCEPDAYLEAPDNCVPLGPSQYLMKMASLGMTIPERPLPAYKPDPTLSQLPYRYFKLEDDYVPIYSSPGERGAGINQFPPGFVYVSYTDIWDLDGFYFLMPNGGWIPGKGSRIGEIPTFQGLAFHATPRNSFGWTYDQIPVKSAPGYNAPNTNKWINVYDVIQIYDTQNVDNADWNMIGPNQWVEARKIAQVIVNTTPPEGVTNNRWIEVNLAEQSLAVYEDRQLVFATVIASGLEPYWTKPGLFQIFQKKETETMRNNDPAEFYYLDNVPWTMYYDGARALHGAYWRNQLGYPQSHGCVNLSVGDAHWLFNWAVEGDFVYVHDPLGLTPTDPNLYPNYAY
ncbi:MAG: L,D-transpeptidase [Anaerolineales bacterium]|nr:L,D-transpeptidase [Anaerolineales bacterium]